MMICHSLVKVRRDKESENTIEKNIAGSRFSKICIITDTYTMMISFSVLEKVSAEIETLSSVYDHEQR